jgi:hypothetical protein
MKPFKHVLFLGAFIFGLASFSYAQYILPDVTVIAVKYKYLSAVNNKELPPPVKLLEWKAAQYNIKTSEFYDDDFDEYYISFYLPSGYILATYDANGKILRTAERYTDVSLPATVIQAVEKSYPGWSFTNDLYLVTYQESKSARKVWKILLQKGDLRLRIKTNEKGEFID